MINIGAGRLGFCTGTGICFSLKEFIREDANFSFFKKKTTKEIQAKTNKKFCECFKLSQAFKKNIYQILEISPTMVLSFELFSPASMCTNTVYIHIYRLNYVI